MTYTTRNVQFQLFALFLEIKGTNVTAASNPLGFCYFMWK